MSGERRWYKPSPKRWNFEEAPDLLGERKVLGYIHDQDERGFVVFVGDYVHAYRTLPTAKKALLWQVAVQTGVLDATRKRT